MSSVNQRGITKNYPAYPVRPEIWCLPEFAARIPPAKVFRLLATPPTLFKAHHHRRVKRTCKIGAQREHHDYQEERSQQRTPWNSRPYGFSQGTGLYRVQR